MKRLLPFSFLLGCATADGEATDRALIPWDSFAVVATIASDYSVGALGAVHAETHTVIDNITATSGDSVVHATDEWVVQLNRFNYDTVRLYPLRDWTNPALEFSVGPLANPHDGVLCAGKLFVSLYGRDYIGVYSPTTGNEIGRVRLDAFADGDDVGPEASSLVMVNGLLYAGLQRLNRDDNWQSVGGEVVEIHCEDEAVNRSWAVGANTRIKESTNGADLLVVAEENAGELGGVWRLTPDQEPALERLASATNDSTFIDVGATDTHLVIARHDTFNTYGLSCLSLESGEMSPVVELDSFITDLAMSPDGKAWVATRPHWETPSASAGIEILEPTTCDRQGLQPITTELPPYSLDFIQADL